MRISSTFFCFNHRLSLVKTVFAFFLVPVGVFTSPALSETGLGEISGQVLDAATGKPIAGAEIFVIVEIGGCPSLNTSTNDQGIFHFSQLLQGRYRLRVEKLGYPRIEWGATSENGFGTPVVLIPSMMKDTLVFALPRAGQISGVISDEQGKPMVNGYVFFDSPELKGQAFYTRTDQHGMYWVADFRPAQYHISAQRFSEVANQTVGDVWYYPGVLSQDEAKLVEISEAGTIVDIRFGPHQEPTWRFRVLSSEGNPLARVEVSISSQANTQESLKSIGILRTGADGFTDFQKQIDGDLFASVLRTSPPYMPWYDPREPIGTLSRYAVKLSQNVAQARYTEFTVTQGREIRIALVAGKEVESSALRDPGFSLELIVDTPMGAILAQPQRTQGEFILNGLIPDERYRMRVIYQDVYRKFCPVKIFQGESLLHGDDIVPDDQEQQILVEVVRCAVVSGTTTASTDLLSAERVGGADLSWGIYEDPGTTLHATTSEGKFVIRGIPPGKYVLRNGAHQRISEFEVTTGDMKEIIAKRIEHG